MGPTELMEGAWSLEEWNKDIEVEMASHFRPLEDWEGKSGGVWSREYDVELGRARLQLL